MAGGCSVLISGASSGIGRACALRMARAGFLVFAGVRGADDAARMREDLAREGGEAAARVHPVPMDVTDPDAIAAALDVVACRLGGRGLNGLVNNAGIAVACPLEFLDAHDFQHQMDVNLRGPFLVTRAALPLLREARAAGDPARIVMMSSVAAGRVLPFFGPYSASKSALEALSHALRLELQAWGIQVAIVEPGSIRTPLWDKSLASYDARFLRLPERARAWYREAYDRVRDAAVRCADAGREPENVAASVQHALTASRARSRYRSGAGAKLLPAWRLLPTVLTDLVTLTWLGLRP